jgi:hypothetical protein
MSNMETDRRLHRLIEEADKPDILLRRLIIASQESGWWLIELFNCCSIMNIMYEGVGVAVGVAVAG